MSKKYTKTITREIRSSFGRFVAIISIVALGVGFLVGILSSTPDMKATADKYYSDYSMSDFDLKSTMGFTADDVKAIENIDEIHTVMPACVTDALVTVNKETMISGRIHGLDMNNISLNQLELKDGRMPEDRSECVIEKPSASMEDVTLGDTIAISPDNENIDDTYRQKKFKVVGIVDSPYYFSSSKEPSSAGTGRAGVIMYTWSSAYKTEVYTDIFILTKYNHEAFSDSYDSYIDDVTEKIEKVSDIRIPARHQEIVDEAMEDVLKAKDTLSAEKSKAEKEFADAERKLADGQREYNSGLAQIKDAKADVNSGYKELEKAKKQVADGRAELAKGQAKLDDTKSQLDSVKGAVEQAKAAISAGAVLPDEIMQQIAAYDAGLAEWEAGTAEFKKQKAALDSADAEILKNEKELAKASTKISENETTMRAAAAELADGRNELTNGRAKADAEFSDAEQEIADAEKEISEIEEPEWYILDRDSNLSYAKYSIDVEKVAAVATVFPVFFFLVAALVSLTTMTRMVEEERIQIGTLKALGYRRRTIASKYMIYCGAATVIGCAIGLAFGFKLIPTILFVIFKSQYDLPPLVTEFNVNYAILSCGLEIICTLGATWLACRHTLKEKPSQLMIPRAPKAGKRILLERVTFLWKRLSFTHKATARNIFRYKKHLFMTVIGIAGCTALMLAGFGLKDSLTALVNTQFDELLKYDMKIELSEDKSDDILEDFLKGKNSLSLMSSTVDVESDKNKEQISSSLYVPETPDKLKEFVVLRDRQSGESVIFDTSSVIITEKMADILEVSPGDTLTVTDTDGADAEFALTGIVENYAGCYIYVAPEIYLKGFDSIKNNCYLLDSGVSGQQAQDEISSSLRESEYVSNIEFTTQSRETYQTILESLTFLVYVLIVFAGLLAVVVLYNLTNININERIRELAALRVLGYHHREVAMYIFREIGILSILGTAAGLILGKALLHYIVLIAESSDMMFGRETDPSSYLLATALTIVFSALVDLLMLRKLRNIDMAASMKAVD